MRPEFQAIESAWRGLRYPGPSIPRTDATLKIRVMKRLEGTNCIVTCGSTPRWRAGTRSPLFKQIYEYEFGQLGRRAVRLPDRRLLLQPRPD